MRRGVRVKSAPTTARSRTEVDSNLNAGVGDGKVAPSQLFLEGFEFSELRLQLCHHICNRKRVVLQCVSRFERTHQVTKGKRVYRGL